jgi:hypothetical protein
MNDSTQPQEPNRGLPTPIACTIVQFDTGRRWDGQPYVNFGLMSEAGVSILIENVWQNLLYADFEIWKRYQIQHGPESRSRSRVTITPLASLQPDWFQFRLRIPAGMPLHQIGMHADMLIHRRFFEPQEVTLPAP